jgi:hypothetical protein
MIMKRLLSASTGNISRAGWIHSIGGEYDGSYDEANGISNLKITTIRLVRLRAKQCRSRTASTTANPIDDIPVHLKDPSHLLHGDPNVDGVLSQGQG